MAGRAAAASLRLLPVSEQRAVPQAERAKRGVDLVCVPYAGGGPESFQGWQAGLPATRLHVVELAGRRATFGQPLPRSVNEVVDDLLSAVLTRCGDRVAMFGHSVGALIAFELAVRLEQCDRSPIVLMVSGCAAPNVRRARHHDLPEAEFVELLRSFGQTPPQILDDRDARALFLPIVRADFAMAQAYRPPAGTTVRCPVVALCGAEDRDADRTRTADWRRVTAGEFVQEELPGGHLFVDSARRQVVNLVGAVLDRLR